MQAFELQRFRALADTNPSIRLDEIEYLEPVCSRLGVRRGRTKPMDAGLTADNVPLQLGLSDGMIIVESEDGLRAIGRTSRILSFDGLRGALISSQSANPGSPGADNGWAPRHPPLGAAPFCLSGNLCRVQVLPFPRLLSSEQASASVTLRLPRDSWRTGFTVPPQKAATSRAMSGFWPWRPCRSLGIYCGKTEIRESSAMLLPLQRFLTLGLLVTAALAAGSALAQSKPPLSAEIGAVIEAEGIDAARQRFAEIYPARKDEYEIDMQGMMAVAQRSVQDGNMEVGMAVMEMLSVVSQDMASEAMGAYNPQMAEMQQRALEQEVAEREQVSRDREEAQRVQQRAEAQSRGRSRDDLDRFAGIYGDPADRDRLRTLFVTVSCDGYLVTGPMWADVGPWWMRSAADSVFTYADDWTNLSMEFTGSGENMKLTHDVEGADSPAERLGPLPADWPQCQERPLR